MQVQEILFRNLVGKIEIWKHPANFRLTKITLNEGKETINTENAFYTTGFF